MNISKAIFASAFFVSLAAAASPAAARVYNLGIYQGGAAAAQYNYERFGRTGYALDGDIRNTCVMSCRRDFNPCDPPEYKHADGRCERPFD